MSFPPERIRGLIIIFPCLHHRSSLPLHSSLSYRIRSPFIRYKLITLNALMKLKNVYVVGDASDTKVDVTVCLSKPSGKHAAVVKCGVSCLNIEIKDEQLNHSSGHESTICMSTNASVQELQPPNLVIILHSKYVELVIGFRSPQKFRV